MQCTYCICLLFGRVDFISFNFTLFALFNKKDIEEYNKIESFIHFNVLLKSDRYSGISVEAHTNTRLKRSHRDNFRTTATVVDIFVIILLILSSGTYLYSIVVAMKLLKVVHAFTRLRAYGIIHVQVLMCMKICLHISAVNLLSLLKLVIGR